MDKATEKFENYIDLWVKLKPSVADKIMFCVHNGIDNPPAIRERLGIAKGNLANCCKQMRENNMIIQRTQGKDVKYELAKKGQEHIKKFLEKI